jgi:hypothetical protein
MPKPIVVLILAICSAIRSAESIELDGTGQQEIILRQLFDASVRLNPA